MARGKAYTAEEHAAIARAWIKASEDPRRGTSQKAEDFWSTVEENYNRARPATAPPRVSP